MDCSPPASSVTGDSPGKNTGVGCHALLQDIFPTQGSNPCLLWLLHCKWILYWCATREAHYNYSVLHCAVLSHSVMFDFLRPHGRNPPGSSVHGESLGKNIGVGCHSLLQGIFPTQGSTHDSCISHTAGRFFTAEPTGKPWVPTI